MRVLRDTESISKEITSCTDRAMADLLAARLQFVVEYDEGPITVIVVEPGDTLAALDDQFDGRFLINYYSDLKLGNDGFVPPFETLDEHPTFFEMFFIEGGGELGICVLVPKTAGISPQLLARCARHATPAEGET